MNDNELSLKIRPDPVPVSEAKPDTDEDSNHNHEHEDQYVCSVIHEDVVTFVRDGLSDEEVIKRTAELFKAVSDPTRLRIINALILSEMCVCDIATLLSMTQPAISHHLKILRQMQLVKYRREGKIVYYQLDDEHVRNLFYQGLLHAGEHK